MQPLYSVYAAFLSLFIVVIVLIPDTTGIRHTFRTFEEYLQHLDKDLQSSIIKLGGEKQIPSVSTTSASNSRHNVALGSNGNNSDGSTENTLINAVVEEEKKNVTCCILGELAGDKGFHCFAEFYAARVVLRNMNRSHNQKLGFYGRFKVPRYGKHLMKTFEQCVAGYGQVFHRCCHLATLERRVKQLRNAQPRGSAAFQIQKFGDSLEQVSAIHQAKRPSSSSSSSMED